MKGEHEFEIKLELSERTFLAILGLMGKGAEPEAQENLFFDTQGALLKKNRWALRIRLEKGEATLTAKGERVSAEDGVFHRPELECGLSESQARDMAAGWQLDDSLPPSKALVSRFGPLRVSPVLRFSNQRLKIPWKSWTLELDRSRAGNTDFFELEVETDPARKTELLRDLQLLFSENAWPFILGKKSKLAKAAELLGAGVLPSGEKQDGP